MYWFTQFNSYCERTDFSFWSEPLNAITNGAFLITALIIWRRTRGNGAGLTHTLIAILILIGVGSFLFHTLATQWAQVADIIPIGVFVLTYLYAVNRHIFGWHSAGATVGTIAFLPYTTMVLPIFKALPFFHISSFYWTIPLLLLIYSPFVAMISNKTAKGMLIGAGILSISITLRSIDDILCGAWPWGTHMFWHVLNAIMLGWMIDVYNTHMVAARGNQG